MNFLFSSRRQHTRYWRDWSSDVCSSDLDQTFTDKMLLAEANQWPEDAAAYFGDGDECHMNFHFPLMPRLFMAVRLRARRGGREGRSLGEPWCLKKNDPTVRQ